MTLYSIHPDTGRPCEPFAECCLCYRALQLDRNAPLAHDEFARDERIVRLDNDYGHLCGSCYDENGLADGDAVVLADAWAPGEVASA